MLAGYLIVGSNGVASATPYVSAPVQEESANSTSNGTAASTGANSSTNSPGPCQLLTVVCPELLEVMSISDLIHNDDLSPTPNTIVHFATTLLPCFPPRLSMTTATVSGAGQASPAPPPSPGAYEFVMFTDIATLSKKRSLPKSLLDPP